MLDNKDLPKEDLPKDLSKYQKGGGMHFHKKLLCDFKLVTITIMLKWEKWLRLTNFCVWKVKFRFKNMKFSFCKSTLISRRRCRSFRLHWIMPLLKEWDDMREKNSSKECQFWLNWCEFGVLLIKEKLQWLLGTASADNSAGRLLPDEPIKAVNLKYQDGGGFEFARHQ